MEKRIAVIGAGNMGGAIVEGLIRSKYPVNSSLFVSDQRDDVVEKIKSSGVNGGSNNREAADSADIIIIAVKPAHIETVIGEIKPVLSAGKILVSIVAGVTIAELTDYAGDEVSVFRVMPNTAISLQESLTCISAGENSGQHRDAVVQLFERLGKVIEIPEELMDAATALSSCGIAFALRFIRAAMQGGVEIGFNAVTAQQIVAQTLKGAAELILQTGNHPEEEIDKVTTPRGITITGLNEMEHAGFSSSVVRGVISSFNKIEKGKR